MEKIRIELRANDQTLTIDDRPKIIEETVSYVEAKFYLGHNWTTFDIIKAIWTDGRRAIATVIGHDGVVTVPSEVLRNSGIVRVNLVGVEIVGTDMIERLTTAQILCIAVKNTALIDGEDPDYITPAYIEQLVALAQQAAGNAGFMYFEIDEDGYLHYYRTNNCDMDFYLDDGDLYWREVND